PARRDRRLAESSPASEPPRALGLRAWEHGFFIVLRAANRKKKTSIMTSQSWLRGLTPALAPTLKKSRHSAPRTRDHRYRPSVERLEDRALMVYDLGYAFNIGKPSLRHG